MWITANLEKASTSPLINVALSIDSSTDLSLGLWLSTALSKDKEQTPYSRHYVLCLCVIAVVPTEKNNGGSEASLNIPSVKPIDRSPE